MKKRSVPMLLCVLIISMVFMTGCSRKNSGIYYIESGTYETYEHRSNSFIPLYLTVLAEENTYILFEGGLQEPVQGTGLFVSDNGVWTLYDEDNVASASLVPMADDAVCLVVSPTESLVFTKLDIKGVIVP